MMRRAAAIATAILLASCATEAPPTSTHVTPPIERWHTNYAEINLFADSASPVTDARVQDFAALTGKQPTYWGRYICHNNAAYNLTPDELSVFARTGVQPILILQPGQATLSGGEAEADTAADCVEMQLASLRSAYSFPVDLMLVLDVENNTQLSADYLRALVNRLQGDSVLASGMRFGIYLSGAYSQRTRAVIQDEIRDGLPITVLWFARYVDTSDCGPLPYWVENDTDALGSVSVPTEMWQYAVECHRYGGEGDGAFDLNAMKPPVYPWNGASDRVSLLIRPSKR